MKIRGESLLPTEFLDISSLSRVPFRTECRCSVVKCRSFRSLLVDGAIRVEWLSSSLTVLASFLSLAFSLGFSLFFSEEFYVSAVVSFASRGWRQFRSASRRTLNILVLVAGAVSFPSPLLSVSLSLSACPSRYPYSRRLSAPLFFCSVGSHDFFPCLRGWQGVFYCQSLPFPSVRACLRGFS